MVSVAPLAEIVRDADENQLVEPPDTVGLVGTVRSSFTVPCTHADVLPAASMAGTARPSCPARCVTELPEVDPEKRRR
jgi:hypothetical protein